MKNIKTLQSAESAVCDQKSAHRFPAACRAILETLKGQLVQHFSVEFLDLDEQLVRRAVNDADALASSTGIPHLLLPALAEEKVRNASAWSIHQREIFQRSGLALAA